MIYLKFLAVILANVGACAHTFRTFARTATVIRCLIWLSLYGGCRVTDFSVNLPATQVHIKARSSCITADRTSKRNAFFFSLTFSLAFSSLPLLLSFVLLLSLLSSYFPLFLMCSSARNSVLFARVSSVSNAWRDVCTETTYKNQY